MIPLEDLPIEPDSFVNTYRKRFVEEDDDFQQSLEEWAVHFRREVAATRRRVAREEMLHRAICGAASVTPHQRERDKMVAEAVEGRELLEREADLRLFLTDAEIGNVDNMHVACGVDNFLSETIPQRMADYAAAGAVLQAIRAAGCRCFVQHGAVRVSDQHKLPSRLLGELNRLNGEIGVILDSGG